MIYIYIYTVKIYRDSVSFSSLTVTGSWMKFIPTKNFPIANIYSLHNIAINDVVESQASAHSQVFAHVPHFKGPL